ncbi:hypothetical protein [Tunicatimonas pelagia]|uniref:hypothetical protein n=1 Tax=Tunicatimonas pelagia TaxID=931531 RepID=UPI002665B795|nr:hypothetical protein [Tunicatimonas pelagia]WKN44135.1 hypothetical protein P0M28_04030 [Tunicatimonas pelagia]
MIQLFATDYGCTFQSDQDRCFYLHFQGREMAMSVCSLIAFKKKVDSIDLVKLLTDESDYSDVALLSTCQREAIFLLSIREIIDLKELLSGTLVMLELNSILHQQLNCGIS